VDSESVVVLGAGLTGLVVSRALSRHGITHVLVGRPPTDEPRLGESMNGEGSAVLLADYAEFGDHFHPKERITFSVGAYASTADFHIAEVPRNRRFFASLGQRPPRTLIHVERIGFDRALFHAVTTSPTCTFIDASDAHVVFDRRRDRVHRVEVADGPTLPVRYAFDASNHRRTIGRAAGVTTYAMSAPQRVVFTHYLTAAGAPPDPPPTWMHATSLRRLSLDEHGLDGVAWCIPLGSRLSVGVSFDARQDAVSDAAALRIVEAAYAGVGIDVRGSFPRPLAARAMEQRYFTHERGHGENWLLAGGSYAQIWYMSGSGVGTSLAAARIAPRLLADPHREALAYERYMEHLCRAHAPLGWYVHVDPKTVTRRAIAQCSDDLILSNMRRLASFAQLGTSRPRRVAAAIIARALGSRWMHMNGYTSNVRLGVEADAATKPTIRPSQRAVGD